MSNTRRASLGGRQKVRHAAVDQARLFVARDHVDRQAQQRLRLGHEHLAVRGLAQRRRGHRPHALHVGAADALGKTRQAGPTALHRRVVQTRCARRARRRGAPCPSGTPCGPGGRARPGRSRAESCWIRGRSRRAAALDPRTSSPSMRRATRRARIMSRAHRSARARRARVPRSGARSACQAFGAAARLRGSRASTITRSTGSVPDGADQHAARCRRARLDAPPARLPARVLAFQSQPRAQRAR